MSRDPRRWTPAEDALLREGYRLQAADPSGKGRTINWSEIAKAIPGRSNKDCRKRYFNEVSGCLKKGPWTENEDARLKGYVQQSGLSWALIAQKMENRSADQCSKRWHHCLDPALDRGQWTDEDNQCLLLALATHGNSWKDIQMIHFPTRSANNIKNQYTVLAHKAITVPPDAPPCCQPRNHPTPVSYSSESSSVSTPLQSDGSNLMTMNHNFFSLESTNSPGHMFPECNPVDLFSLQDQMTQNNLDFRRPELRNNSSSALGSTFSSSELLDMSELDGAGLNASSMALAFAPGKGDFDAVPLTEGTRIGDWGMGLDDNDSTMANAPTTSGNIQAHSSEELLRHLVVPHCGGVGKVGQSAGSDSRFTITIDDADSETMMGVMQVLVQSSAKVEFQRG